MPRFQFHLNDLLVSLTLVFVGLGSMAIASGQSWIPDPPGVVSAYFAVSSPMWIGAGIGAPFQKKAIGAAIGFCIGISPIIYAITMMLMYGISTGQPIGMNGRG